MAPLTSQAMSSLQPGVILKLLQSTNLSSQNGILALTRHLDPAILQVTGITPAIAGPDIFSGHRGFYLRLSDLSHSSYFSLPPEHDDLILGDRLHLGQLVQVNILKPAVPVPILHDFHLLPGRFPCLKDTTDLTVPNPNSESQSTDIKEVVYTRPQEVVYTRPPLSPSIKSHIPIPRSMSASAKTWSVQPPPENTMLKKKEMERRSSDVLSELRKFSVMCAEEDSGNDSDESLRSRISSCTTSSYSSSSSLVASLKSARKSWDDSESIKENKPTHTRSRSTSLSPNRLAPQRSISKIMMPTEIIASKRRTERAFNVLGSYSKRKQNYPVPIKPTGEMLSSCTMSSPVCSVNTLKWPDSNIAWGNISLSLSKHGKEVLKHRDSALQTALDALLEASASEKLIQCLSAYGEIQSDKDDDSKDLIDRFLKFHQNLEQTIQIIQPMTKQKVSNKMTSKIASERKQCAHSWIKGALNSNLTKYPNQTNFYSALSKDGPVNESKIINPVTCCHKTKLRKNVENSNEPNTFSAVIELAVALRFESTRWFLRYVEKFLDAVEACESHVGGLLNQMKKLDDWLNKIVRKEKVSLVEKNKDGAMLSEEEENEACERVRKKIYGVLLRHVESAAVALESLSAYDEEEKDMD